MVVLPALLLPVLAGILPARTAEFAVVQASRGPVVRYVILPGTLRANQQATLYAKVPGYLKSLAVDTGDRVEAGQALAELEVPELQADRTRYRAEVKVATTDAARMTAARQHARTWSRPRPWMRPPGGWKWPVRNWNGSNPCSNSAS